MTNPFNSGPISAERNPPINPEWYQPRKFIIESITMGSTTLVTTTLDNDFVIGQLIRLLIPSYWGANQLNQKQAYVLSLPDTDQVVLDINSIGYSSFALSAYHPSVYQYPQIIPLGDVNTGVINSQGRVNQGTYIPGSFVDISPS